MMIEEQCRCKICYPQTIIPTAIEPKDYLKCLRWKNVELCASNACEMERDFYLPYQAAFDEWWKAGLTTGEIRVPEQWKFGASTFVSSVFDLGNPIPLEELSGHHVMFIILAEGGISSDWSIEEVVSGLNSYTQYLGDHDHISKKADQNLRKELSIWSPRLLDFFKRRIWYRKDGTRVDLSDD